MVKIIYTKNYNKIAGKFLKSHPELKKQYAKSLELLSLNPYHPSLRLHKLQGNLSNLFSISINISYRITMEFLIENDQIILLNVGSHNQVY